MKSIGIDIGTTNIGAVVLEDGRVVASRSVETSAFIASEHSWEKIQDAAKIWNLARSMVDGLLDSHPCVSCIGLTGQQHGIVYVNDTGDAVSPLYTWQDSRGQLDMGGESHVSFASRVSGHELHAGYGSVTHLYNVRNGLVPDGAVKFCTIHDYVAMKLSGLASPVTDASDAASFGLFDVRNGSYDIEAISAIGLDAAMYPTLAGNSVIGRYRGVPVTVAIGDNQAGFLGVAGAEVGSMLVNVGTGAQFSVLSDSYVEADGLETRPFPTGGWLLVGASLCGGRAYALLDSFFCETVQMVTGVRPAHCYEAMAAAAAAGLSEPDPVAVTIFEGTRQDPSQRGSISGLSTGNFTPGAFVRSVLRGIAAELFGMSLKYEGLRGNLYGSGNALRLNPLMQEEIESLFGRAPIMSALPEEAACGAALFAQKSNT